MPLRNGRWTEEKDTLWKYDRRSPSAVINGPKPTISEPTVELGQPITLGCDISVESEPTVGLSQPITLGCDISIEIPWNQWLPIHEVVLRSVPGRMGVVCWGTLATDTAS